MPGQKLNGLAIVGVAVVVSSCMAQSRPARPIDRSLLKTPALPRPASTSFSLSPRESESTGFETFDLRYPSSDRGDPDNLEVHAIYRRPTRSRGLVIVLPILGGDYGPSEALAGYLAEQGIATLRFDRRNGMFDPESGFAGVHHDISVGIADVRRSLHWIERERAAGAGRVGILGISMGSFVATAVAALEPRIDAAVLALGGGHIDEILVSARSEEEIGHFYTTLEKTYDEAALAKMAKAALEPIDPLRFAPYLEPQTTLFIHARFDAVVPYRYGTAVWQAAGSPRRITLLSGHYGAALFLPYLLDEISDHFLKHVGGAPSDLAIDLEGLY